MAPRRPPVPPIHRRCTWSTAGSLHTYWESLKAGWEARAPTTLTEFGHVIETFAVNEILKQAGWAEIPLTFSHFRTKDGHEVDLVCETDDGRITGVELKAASSVEDKGFPRAPPPAGQARGRFRRRRGAAPGAARLHQRGPAPRACARSPVELISEGRRAWLMCRSGANARIAEAPTNRSP